MSASASSVRTEYRAIPRNCTLKRLTSTLIELFFHSADPFRTTGTEYVQKNNLKEWLILDFETIPKLHYFQICTSSSSSPPSSDSFAALAFAAASAAAAISALTFIWCSKKAARCGAEGAKCGGMKWAMELTTKFSAAVELFEDGGGESEKKGILLHIKHFVLHYISIFRAVCTCIAIVDYYIS